MANPVATILSAAMMLRWLGHRHRDGQALAAAERVDGAVEEVLADPKAGTPDIGGVMTTGDMGREIAGAAAGAGSGG